MLRRRAGCRLEEASPATPRRRGARGPAATGRLAAASIPTSAEKPKTASTDEPVHGRVVDAVEREGRVVEVLEAVSRRAQDWSEEVMAVPWPSLQRRDLPGDAGSEDRREHKDSGDHRPSPSQRNREHRQKRDSDDDEDGTPRHATLLEPEPAHRGERRGESERGKCPSQRRLPPLPLPESFSARSSPRRRTATAMPARSRRISWPLAS